MKKRKILVVDDEVMIRRVLKRFFDKEGYETFEATSEKTAIEMFRLNRPFDAVLCDISLSGDDGWKVVEYVQRAHPSTPIMVMSGAIQDGVRTDLTFSILYKPFSPSELIEALEKLWSSRQEEAK